MKRRSFFKNSFGAAISAIAAFFGFKAAKPNVVHDDWEPILIHSIDGSEFTIHIGVEEAPISGDDLKVWVNGDLVSEVHGVYLPIRDEGIISTEREEKITFESFTEL